MTKKRQKMFCSALVCVVKQIERPVTHREWSLLGLLGLVIYKRSSSHPCVCMCVWEHDKVCHPANPRKQLHSAPTPASHRIDSTRTFLNFVFRISNFAVLDWYNYLPLCYKLLPLRVCLGRFTWMSCYALLTFLGVLTHISNCVCLQVILTCFSP